MGRRVETRAQRYLAKAGGAVRHNFSIVTVEFHCDENVGYLIRAAACQGAATVHVIGHLPDEMTLKRLSGGTNNFVQVFQHQTPQKFLEWKRENDTTGQIVSAELVDGSQNIHNFRYDPAVMTYIVVGNEEAGVPAEILHRSNAVVHIPMPGIGFCLNTSQTANVLAYEYVRQMNVHINPR